MFFDPRRSRINRAALIFIKYGMFVFICENFSLVNSFLFIIIFYVNSLFVLKEPLYFIPACLGAGLGVKWGLNTGLQALAKVTRHANKLFFLLLLGTVITFLIISFFPDTNRLAFTKDEKWSILYLITFAIDFFIIQQLIGFV